MEFFEEYKKIYASDLREDSFENISLSSFKRLSEKRFENFALNEDKISTGIEKKSMENYELDEDKDAIPFYLQEKKKHEEIQKNEKDDEKNVFTTINQMKENLFKESQQTINNKRIENRESLIFLGNKTGKNKNIKKPKIKPAGEKIKNKKLGRKRNDSYEFSEHNKTKPDNIMRKVKTKISAYTLNNVNKSIITPGKEFKKLDAVINENLKKDYNMNLLNMKVEKIFEEISISRIYKTISPSHNSELIEYIKKNRDIEKEAFDLLQLTYEEMITKFNNDEKEGLRTFISEVREKEENSQKKVPKLENYLNDIEDICKNFKDKFDKIIGRNREKSKNE